MLLYLAFFLPTTINTAWLSVAAGVGVLIVPASYAWQQHSLEVLAVVLMVLVTALGIPPRFCISLIKPLDCFNEGIDPLLDYDHIA